MSVPCQFAAGVYRTVPAAASTMVTVPCAPWVTAVIVGVAPSKLSLPRTLLTTLPSSFTETLSAAMSGTALTLSVMTCVAVWPSSSVTVTVKLSAPL
ncbi:hypothetical protein HK414_02930 [Ramlibacter terrae]|uniref:Uncharacterized protein n=1 Tax=Ramlibacter terrae TaxID=2732511 RepID=A0ABX6P090_9BURK|nr:hypothetical protein HK414_02930 [Ramlibacter terrae]